MDRASMIGILLGLAAVIGGNAAEGGRIDSIFQPTAALIVFGGTVGATLLSFPLEDIFRAAASLREVFFERRADHDRYIDELIRFSDVARRNGLVALEKEIPGIADPFFRKAMTLAVDQMGPRALRDTMEQQILTHEEERRKAAKVFETAGGFAPTIGILGAVLGLIHVMENLSDPARLGSGIAVAFVATVYGVGSANLLLLPIAKKLHGRLRHELSVREMVIEGVLGIQSGMNPYYLRERLKVFVEEGRRSARAGRREGR